MMRTNPDRRRLRAAGVVAVLVGSLLLAGCASPSTGSDDGGPAAQIRTSARTDGYHGVVLDTPYAMPAVTFTTSRGDSLDPAATPVAPVTLVFFGYSHCPDVCNAVLADVAAALRRADDAVRERTKLLFITTDPARDTPEVMHDYLARFDPSFLGLRTDLETTKTVATSLGVALTGTTELPGGGYDVGHSAQVIGFDADGVGRLVWTPGTPVGDLRADLTKLARG